MKKLFSVQNAAGDAPTTICCYGPIGADYGEGGITAEDFRTALQGCGSGEVHCHVNTKGGSLWDALPIYNMLHAIKHRVTCFVDGLAASAGSIIAIAGRKCVMPQSALMMIHMPTIVTAGNATELRREADKLDAHCDMLVNIYQQKTGKGRDAIVAAMARETWMTGPEAQAFGLADEIVDDAAAPVSAFADIIPPQGLAGLDAYSVALLSGAVRAHVDHVEAMRRLDAQQARYEAQRLEWQDQNPLWQSGVLYTGPFVYQP